MNPKAVRKAFSQEGGSEGGGDKLFSLECLGFPRVVKASTTVAEHAHSHDVHLRLLPYPARHQRVSEPPKKVTRKLNPTVPKGSCIAEACTYVLDWGRHSTDPTLSFSRATMCHGPSQSPSFRDLLIHPQPRPRPRPPRPSNLRSDVIAIFVVASSSEKIKTCRRCQIQSGTHSATQPFHQATQPRAVSDTRFTFSMFPPPLRPSASRASPFGSRRAHRLECGALPWPAPSGPPRASTPATPLALSDGRAAIISGKSDRERRSRDTSSEVAR